MIKYGLIISIILAAIGGLAPWNYVSISSPVSGVYNITINTNGLGDATKIGLSKVKNVIDQQAAQGEAIQYQQNQQIQENNLNNLNDPQSIISNVIHNEINKNLNNSYQNPQNLTQGW